jgi:hypothetical protein
MIPRTFASSKEGPGADEIAEAARRLSVPISSLPTLGAMFKKLVALALLAVAGGCRMCSDSCDYTSPVAGGSYLGTRRAGSNLGAAGYATTPPPAPDVPDNPPPRLFNESS